MYDCRCFYIDGRWVNPAGRDEATVIDPATERPIGRILLGQPEDVDAAVHAANNAFGEYSQTSREERLALLDRIIYAYEARISDIGRAVSHEMGAPLDLATNVHAVNGNSHFKIAREVLETFEFEEVLGTTSVRREPIGVCGLITPWNWPMNQMCCKLAPALATGCTIVLKPSELSPLSAHILAEILSEARVPRGVFNLVDGTGPVVGEAISRHPGVDMVSFTGSTRAGVAVAKAAADTVKRVSQELGGKSANIILEDADLNAAVTAGVKAVMINSGQSCNAPTRMLIPAKRYREAIEIACAALEDVKLGPVANGAQFERVQLLIEKGVAEGARVVAGGPGRPDGVERGYYVKPTIFADVNNDMSIAREEIFGPVLVLIPYVNEEEAVRIANDSIYGLSGHVHGTKESAQRVAKRLRTGMVHLNGALRDFAAPFGGYKQSGNGREWGKEGFREYLEIKSIMGFY